MKQQMLECLQVTKTLFCACMQMWRSNKLLGSFAVKLSSISTLKETVKQFPLDCGRGTVTVGLMFKENARTAGVTFHSVPTYFK